MTLPEDEPGGDQPADAESQTDESQSQIEESPSETAEPSSETEPFIKSDDSGGDAPEPDPSTVQVDTTQLDRAQDAIDDARAAVKKVAATDSIDEEATGAGELPAFADSVAGVEKPKPPEDDSGSDAVGDSED
ncbi:MAG TPA: hypothetical protein VEX66_08220 [Microlunatus sp.]|nr:hypothetical protein [Microlunatus sp.]